MNLAKYLACSLVVVLGFGCAQFLFAQGTDLGTIGGLVTDASGAVVTNAKVIILDLATNAPRETKTNAQGEYRVFGLSSGEYQVSVSAPGMSTTTITGIRLHGSDTVSADAVLKVASATQAIEVRAEAPIIDTEDQTISGTVSSRAVVDLPRDSRNVYSFLYLNPNITQGSVDGQFKFLGAQSYGASFTLDGQSSNGGIFGEPTSSQPSLEAVSEINVLSNDFSAEYAGIANIRVTTKRGESRFHGSMFYNNKNSALAALTLQDKQGIRDFVPTPFESHFPTPYFNFNDIGGSIGGPIPFLKKTWFFTAYERNYARSPVNILSSKVAHPTLWGGDFSLLNPTAMPEVPDSVFATLTPAEIADTASVCDPDSGLCTNRFIHIPSRLLNPTVQNLIGKYFPKIGVAAPIDPDTGRISPNFQTLIGGGSTQDVGTLRIDHDFSEKDHVYGVYNVSALTGATAAVVAPYTGLGLTQTDRRNNTVSASYVRTIHNNLINELRGGFNRQKLFVHSNTTLDSFLSSIGFDASDIDAYAAVVGPSELSTHGHMAINFSNAFATFTNGGRNTDRPLDQNLLTFGDTLTWVLGKHNFKMGADLVRNQAVDGFAVNRGNVRGLLTYGAPPACSDAGTTSDCTGVAVDSFSDFLMGLPPNSVSYVSQPRPPMNVYNWEQGYFFQDDWKMTPRLTLNLGLRYELITPFIEKNDLIANFDPNFVDPTTGQLGRFVIPSTRTLKFLDPRIVAFGVVTADKSGLGVGRGVVRTDKNNFAPRVGFAFRLSNKSVVRGGYGFYFPTSAAQGIRDPIATNPFNQGVTKRDKGTPLQGWPGFDHGFSPLTGGDIKGTGNTPAVNVVPFGLQQPRIQQYNATYERELGLKTALRLSYLGSTMSGLIGGRDLNELKPNDLPFGTTMGDGVTICDPLNGDCAASDADNARYRFPALGDFVLSYGNFGHTRTNSFQTQLEHRYTGGLMFSVAYTYLNQKSTGLDTGNSSLGGIVYNPFLPDHDYGQEAFVPHHRLVAYGIYELPVGHSKRFGSGMSKWADAIIGGWQTTFNMFAKTGTGFTPHWICDDCNPVEPGNIAVSSVDAVGDFNVEPSFRPVVTGNYKKHVGDQIFDPSAFGPPPVGSDVFDNPSVAKRNLLIGPGTWGVNLGLHKSFHLGDRLTATLGADFDNIFNHPLLSPDQSDNGGSGGAPFALLGDFNVRVDQATGKLLPITEADISRNPDFGRLFQSFTQEGVDSRRTVRLRLRITF
jgi:Carboxypeptidase regulatory-like domain/TonB dependent receptor